MTYDLDIGMPFHLDPM